MPPKNKRKLQIVESLERARESKRSRKSGEGSSSSTVTEVRSERVGADAEDITLAQLIVMPEDALDTDDETVDPSFDLDSSIKSDVDHTVETFCEDWVCQLDRDDRVSLGSSFVSSFQNTLTSEKLRWQKWLVR